MKKGKITYIRYFIKNAPSSFFRVRLLKKAKRIDKFEGYKNISIESSSALLENLIKEGKPFAAIRFGGTELGCLNNAEKIKFGFTKTYKDAVRRSMKVFAGFYPTGDKHLQEFADLLETRLTSLDALAISGIHMEDYFYHKYCPQAKVLQNWAMEPLIGGWTPLLKGKKVLVISGFADDIAFQYSRREKIFPNEPSLLPEFDLQVLAAPMTMGYEEDPRFPSFMRSLEELESAIDLLDFDIALVGAGAYGSLLCLHIKNIGKMAIQSGGATQTLFGIIGRRWENRSHVSSRINSNWIRPSIKPKGFDHIEKGAYW